MNDRTLDQALDMTAAERAELRARVERLVPRPFAGCTSQCADPVPCPSCGRALPPRGRSVAAETNLPTCCDTARMDPAINTRHIWSVGELES